jgi:mannose-6-phosphate isomerase-like protein (cupin superfamily)
MQSLKTAAVGAAAALVAAGILWAGTTEKPTGKVVVLDTKGQNYLEILGGPPESYGMESGLAVIAPGKSVGAHSTNHYEELLVILEGRGEMRTSGGLVLSLSAGTAAYCPPHSKHNVFNTGEGNLRYVYVVSPTEPPDSTTVTK